LDQAVTWLILRKTLDRNSTINLKFAGDNRAGLKNTKQKNIRGQKVSGKKEEQKIIIIIIIIKQYLQRVNRSI
jgi:hypothetical protein